MFRKNQLETVLAEKNSAMKVFVITKNKFVASCKKAQSFLDTNLNEINKKEQEILEKKDLNVAIGDQMKSMEASIVQIDTILNPVVVKVEDAGEDVKITVEKSEKPAE
jgi:hypothetical protein